MQDPTSGPWTCGRGPWTAPPAPSPAHPPPWRAPCHIPAHDSGWAVSVERGPGGSLPGQREGRPLSGAGRTGRRPGRRCLPTQAGREAACWRLAARTGPHPAPASSPDLSPGPQNSGQLSSARPQGSAGRSLAPRCAWRLCPAGSSGARPPCVGDISESRDSSGCPRNCTVSSVPGGPGFGTLSFPPQLVTRGRPARDPALPPASAPGAGRGAHGAACAAQGRCRRRHSLLLAGFLAVPPSLQAWAALGHPAAPLRPQPRRPGSAAPSADCLGSTHERAL